MVSKRAQADVEDMWEEGLKPTFHDIIRLNALAVKVERVDGGFSLSALPRVSFLGDVIFREPTIGSEIWFGQACRRFDDNDDETYMLLRSFSLSMPQDELPDPLDQLAVRKGIQEMKDKLAFATFKQLANATAYVIHGFSSDAFEVPAKKKDAGDDGKDDDTDPLDVSYDIGLLRQGMVYRIGSVEELKNLPPAALREMVSQAMSRDYMENVRKTATSTLEDDYLRTLDEITERLRKEKNG